MEHICDFSQLKTPCYVVDQDRLLHNLEILRQVIRETGCKILLAQKAFSMFSLYPLIGEYLDGTTASSLYEARLGHDYMPGRETHIFAPAYRAEEMGEILSICDHVVFNSFRGLEKYRDQWEAMSGQVSCGIRVNPGYSEVGTDLYNPCARYSRLGVTLDAFEQADKRGLEGLHFHTLCEQQADVLWRTLQVVEGKFGKYLDGMKWLNFGGGHHITKEGYDTALLGECIRHFKQRYGLEVYLEPGEAVALNTGYLAARVLDVKGGAAILDASAACHMPDVLEMPYRPGIAGAGKPGEKAFTYRLGGNTCLAGDIIGDYSFDAPLKEGALLVFTDMAHYTMVKNNTFNGIGLPSIWTYSDEKGLELVRKFDYDDFKGRLS